MINPQKVYEYCVDYLHENGWQQDGDDPMIWFSDEFGDAPFDDALYIQFRADGVPLNVIMQRAV